MEMIKEDIKNSKVIEIIIMIMNLNHKQVIEEIQEEIIGEKEIENKEETKTEI
jgi:hypothetical protein